MADNELKQCAQCGQIKNRYTDYYWSGKNTRTICKECVKANERKRYAEKIAKINEYKQSLSCKKCGEKRFYLLEFHHTDPSQKDYAISDKIRVDLEKLLPELEKCDPLCCNCHREWHYLYDHGLIDDYDTWLKN
jgi:hypothetical protein